MSGTDLTPRERRAIAHTAMASHPRNLAATERLLSERRSRTRGAWRRMLARLAR